MTVRSSSTGGSSSSSKATTSSVMANQVSSQDEERLARFTQTMLDRQLEARKNAQANRLRRLLNFEGPRRPNLNIGADQIFSPIRK